MKRRILCGTLGKLEGDPARLDQVESRLEALDKLKRKYGKTVEEVLAFHADVARRVDEVENASAPERNWRCSAMKRQPL